MDKIKSNIDYWRSISQIFSASNFNKIVKKHDYSLIKNRVNKYINTSNQLNNKDLIKELYKQLMSYYRVEYLYKNALINKLLLGKYSLNTTTVINEFKIGSSIADFVLINGDAKIFEIKTEFDSLNKLNKQINDYYQFATKVFIVTNSKFKDKLTTKFMNPTLGVIEFTKKNTLKEIIPAKENHSLLDHETIFKTLRKKEYLAILQDFFGYIPNVPNTEIFKKSLSLIKKIDVKEFQQLAIKKLRNRRLKCPELLESKNTPHELKHICYSLNMSKNDYLNLFAFLNQRT